jgi:undecaprenyl diphosphate synthase
MTASTDSLVPQHVAIIMDGNRRWAQQRGLSSKEGHKAGYETLKTTAEEAFSRGVAYITVYAFSTENWSRADDEVGYLMGLMAWVATEEAKEFHAKGIRIRVLGSRERLARSLCKSIQAMEDLTEHNTKGTMNVCFNYGGRSDLVAAIQRLIADGVNPSDIDEARVAGALATAGIPDPDLVIRTSGEERMSNFLVWESAYSELYFTDTLWPDFDAAELDRALAAYAERKRNFGK